MYPVPVTKPFVQHGDLAFSALPEAPVVEDPPSRLRQAAAPVRHALAVGLRAVAEALEPAPRHEARRA